MYSNISNNKYEKKTKVNNAIVKRSHSTVQSIVKKFNKTGILQDKKKWSTKKIVIERKMNNYSNY